MQQKLLIALALLLSAATTQVSAAAEHRHVRAKERAILFEQSRNSNAYAGPSDVSVRSEGAMTSGIAGH
jgi:hypothetical protein